MIAAKEAAELADSLRDFKASRLKEAQLQLDELKKKQEDEARALAEREAAQMIELEQDRKAQSLAEIRRQQAMADHERSMLEQDKKAALDKLQKQSAHLSSEMRDALL